MWHRTATTDNRPVKGLRHPATILAAVALFVALGGGAYATSFISGLRIQNHSIPAKKLTAAAIASLRGQRGPAGQTGPAGPTGPPGPKGDQGPAGTSNVFDFHRDAAAGITGANTTIATGNLTPGNYAIFAKTYLDSSPVTAAVGYASCTLSAGSATDTSSLNMGSQAQQVSRGALSMQVSHVYVSGGPVVVTCSATPGTATVTANATVITAIQVGSVTSTAVTG
jgi:hypothetical protein